MPDRFKLISEVSLLLMRDGKLCLLSRTNTGWMDGKYCYIAGHKEEGESATSAIVREALEEAGIRIDPKDLSLAHVMHRNDSGERVAFFFTTEMWEGEPQNLEPDKHGTLDWYPFDALPDMIPYMRHAFDQYRAGNVYSEFAW